jgi:hypothetical protein
MLSLAKKTDMVDQLGTSDQLMQSLQERAKKLPGSLSDYTKVLGMIAQPIVDAGIGIKDLEDITVGAAVAAKAMSVDLEAGARDVNQAIMGQFHSTDQLTGRLLGSLGYVGEKGRKTFNGLSKERRAAVLKEALTQKQLEQMAAANSQSALGRWDTLKATISETLGRVAKPLFEKVSSLLGGINAWLESNSAAIDQIASAVGSVFAAAFEVAGVAMAGLVAGFTFLTDHGDATIAVLIGIGGVIMAIVVPALISMAAGWIVALAPIILVIAAIALVAYGIIKLVRNWDTVKRGAGVAWDWIKDKISGFIDWIADIGSAIASPFIAAFNWVSDVINKVIDAIMAKINWVVDKAKTVGGWFSGAAKWVANTVTGGGSDLARSALATANTPSLPASASSGSKTTTVNAPATITINGAGDPAAVAAEVTRQQRAMWDSQMRLNEDL